MVPERGMLIEPLAEAMMTRERSISYTVRFLRPIHCADESATVPDQSISLKAIGCKNTLTACALEVAALPAASVATICSTDVASSGNASVALVPVVVATHAPFAAIAYFVASAISGHDRVAVVVAIRHEDVESE